MAFGIIWNFLYVVILLVNAVAVLSEDRFLARIGWTSSSQTAAAYAQTYDATGYGPPDPGIKARIIDLIAAVRTLLRIPLIGINTVIILYELLWIG
ncbi:Yos1-like protein [Schizophyllum commune Tattone D]|nr:Yos1-like protein [Schizophyllum commune H4-8]KAI5830979.1 Yos1-like protein [Schizophyllum commune Tattone D]KAI5893286.1 Yos1-like protein [Schizophyllum commune H4-8]